MSAIEIQKTIQQANIFQSLFDALPSGIALTDKSGRLIYVNRCLATMAKLPQAVLLKSNTIDSLLDHKGDGRILTRVYLQSGNEILHLNGCGLREFSDEPAHLDIAINKVGDYICFTVTKQPEQVQDEPLQHERELQAEMNALSGANASLRRSNQELSQYAYVASHDLQEPLRKIKIYSDMLKSSLTIAVKDKFMAEKIHQASERMTTLIRDLLSYSRLAKPETQVEKIQLGQVIRDILVDFEISIQERGAEISIGELPTVGAVRLQMNQLFYNLVGNALKFTPASQRPLINISTTNAGPELISAYLGDAHRNEEYYLIKIVDNGIGFQQKDSERIFEVFKRLVTGKTYQGSGIGLALCRRIVRNHGGEIFAESRPGKGSTFSILLPAVAHLDRGSVSGA